MEAAARDLPKDAPWKGLESDIERAREATTAGAKMREGATRLAEGADQLIALRGTLPKLVTQGQDLIDDGMPIAEARSEEPRVGEEGGRTCRYRGSQYN